jgi:6-phosphogluconolactonase (cycloisomerase 2 family)
MSILSDILGSTAGSTVAALTPAATVDIDLTSNDFFTLTPDQNTTFTVSNVPASPDVGKFNLALTGFTVGVSGYDLSVAAYDSVSKSVAAQSTNCNAVSFKTDGTKLYILGGNTAYQYTLSTPWDVSSATYDTVSFSVSAQDNNPFGLTFKPDGTKMYMTSSNSSRVYQYTLSTAWDLSTASYDSVSFTTATQDSFPRDTFFKPDGTKMYVVSNPNDRVYQYTLSTPWVVSSATYDSLSFLLTGQDANPFSVQFNLDGTKMFILGGIGDTVFQYTLSTAWDVSSATYDSVSFSVATQESSSRGIYFRPDGFKMYVIGNASNTVHQYTTGTLIPAITTYPASFKFPSGTTPAAPLDGEVDILEFQTTDGGTTWYGTQLGNNFL